MYKLHSRLRHCNAKVLPNLLLQNQARGFQTSSGNCNQKPEVSSHSINVGNNNIHFKTAGSGPYVALCLPGALGSGEGDFGPQLSGLAGAEVTLVAWDPPGYGQSRPPNRCFSLDFLQKDAHLASQFMQKLGHTEYGVLGWSDGGITGIIMAANYAQSVKHLVVWGANAFVSDVDVKIYSGLRDVSSWSERMRAPMEAVYGVQGFKEMWEQWVDTIIEIYKQKDGDLCRLECHQVKCPTLIIQGGQDPVVPTSHAYYLLENIKASKLDIFEDGKHNLHMKYANKFNELTKQFLMNS